MSLDCNSNSAETGARGLVYRSSSSPAPFLVQTYATATREMTIVLGSSIMI
ncbi:hypothetical protein HanPSC8_Chr17g0789191 [Helianthus annuus]|nr:hypothetical protein HanPSC8_Chr17g0789191 [Helianthus annuus]